MHAATRGTFVISVDLERGDESAGRPASAIADRVVASLAGAELTATLAVTQPGASRQVDGLLAGFPQAEVAILAGVSWSRADSPRQAFTHGLSRAMLQARSAGYSIHSLVFPRVTVETHSDLLVKHGVSVLRGVPAAAARSGVRSMLRRFSGEPRSLLVEPRNIRFGLWEVGVSASLPGTPSAVIRAWIDRAAATGGLFQLRIDVPRLADEVRSGLIDLGRVVEHAASCVDAGRLRTATLAEVAANLRRRRQVVSARSILRPRAA